MYLIKIRFSFRSCLKAAVEPEVLIRVAADKAFSRLVHGRCVFNSIPLGEILQWWINNQFKSFSNWQLVDKSRQYDGVGSSANWRQNRESCGWYVKKWYKDAVIRAEVLIRQIIKPMTFPQFVDGRTKAFADFDEFSDSPSCSTIPHKSI